jgi:hypothetical protein
MTRLRRLTCLKEVAHSRRQHRTNCSRVEKELKASGRSGMNIQEVAGGSGAPADMQHVQAPYRPGRLIRSAS